MANEAVRGVAAARRAFKALPAISREAIADATEDTAVHIRAGAVRRVPVRFGFLRNAIAMTMSRRTGVAKVGIQSSRHTTPDGKAVDPAAYGRFQEFGTEHHAAHPFMLPAAEAERAAYLYRCKTAGGTIEREMTTIGSRNI